MNPVPICIFGGTGVFGKLLVEELSRSPVPFQITVAARHPGGFQKAFPGPPAPLRFQVADLDDFASVARALEGQKIMVVAAGPFQNFSPELGGVAARQGAHYLDIGDWPPYYFGLQQWAPDFQAGGLACIPGLSSLPGISIPLFYTLQSEFDRLEAVRVGLFIGNRNRKGFAAMASALRSDPVPCPDFPFPGPIGLVPAFSLSTPEEKILAGISEPDFVQVGVSFEWALARRMFGLLRRFSHGRGVARLEGILKAFASMPGANYFGTERGCISVWTRGLREGQAKTFRASLSAPAQAQRIAILPCVLAAEALARGECRERGWLAPHQWLAPEILIQRLVERGLEYRREEL